jgi:5'(3')-deoxyribonucleotidase
MNRLKLSIDVDDTLYNLTAGNLAVVKELYGDIVTPDMVNSWDYYHVNYPLVLNLWSDWNQYSKLPFFEGDVDFINQLRTEFDIQLVTVSFPEIEVQKDAFLKDRYGDIKIIHTREKSLVTVGSVLIDDAVHNIDCHVRTNSMPAIIMDRSYGWNQGYSHHLVDRVCSFQEALTAIDKLHGLVKVAKRVS